MIEELLEKHRAVVVELAAVYLDNMARELGKKYKRRDYEVNPGLSDAQYMELQKKHGIPTNEFGEIYFEFQKMKPTAHLTKALEAFAGSGGSVDIEPVYDDASGKLDVAVTFMIKDKMFEKIEGLSPFEDTVLRMNAMSQIESVLSDPDATLSF